MSAASDVRLTWLQLERTRDGLLRCHLQASGAREARVWVLLSVAGSVLDVQASDALVAGSTGDPDLDARAIDLARRRVAHAHDHHEVAKALRLDAWKRSSYGRGRRRR